MWWWRYVGEGDNPDAAPFFELEVASNESDEEGLGGTRVDEQLHSVMMMYYINLSG